MSYPENRELVGEFPTRNELLERIRRALRVHVAKLRPGPYVLPAMIAQMVRELNGEKTPEGDA